MTRVQSLNILKIRVFRFGRTNFLMNIISTFLLHIERKLRMCLKQYNSTSYKLCVDWWEEFGNYTKVNFLDFERLWWDNDRLFKKTQKSFWVYNFWQIDTSTLIKTRLTFQWENCRKIFAQKIFFSNFRLKYSPEHERRPFRFQTWSF